MNKTTLEKLVKKNGTPLLIIDHKKIRKNYREFKKRLPKVQAYYAVKANSEPEIIKTLYREGSSFDVASIAELRLVLDTLTPLLQRDQISLPDFIWNNIIYANPVKSSDSLPELNMYKPLFTYDSPEEMKKIKLNCPNAGLLLRIKISNNGSLVKLSNKFGIEPEKAEKLIIETIKAGLDVEGISFHVGSQCNNFENYTKALESIAHIFKKLKSKGYKIGEVGTRGDPIKQIDIGGGFPVKYSGDEKSFGELARMLNKSFDKLFSEEKMDILAEPGRFLVANAGTLVARVILAKHSTRIPCYHIDDGVYHTFSAVMFDHFEPKLQSIRDGEKSECYVFGPTCDGLDELSKNQYIRNTSKIYLPKLFEGDLIYQEDIGAYSNASSTNFNGMPSAKIIHINV
jgi:ornithine decarboxylase